MSETVGLLGVGRMGAPILRLLHGAGRSIDAFDPSPTQLSRVADILPVAAVGAAELAAEVDVLITVLPGPPECEAAMMGEGGALAAMRPGGCWLDFTSNDPRVATRIAEAAAERSIGAVGAPLRGGPAQAEAGELGFYVGGRPDALERVLPILRDLGDASMTQIVGDSVGDGFVAKLLANGLWFSQVVAVTEALLLARSAGIAPRRMREVLENSPGASAFLSHDAARLLAGDYAETFGIDRVVEELDTIEELASEAGTPASLSSIVAALHREALARFGAVDGEMLVARLLEERAGRPLRDG
jgi:3-hydroxyisobutyrate dehydrogenase